MITAASSASPLLASAATAQVQPTPSPTPTSPSTDSTRSRFEPPPGGFGPDLPPRPYGLSGLNDVFGQRCSDRANDARSYWPSAGGRGKGGYVYYHRRLAPTVGGTILAALNIQPGAADYGVWGYACRLKRGGTTWSVHSWGAAIDTNTLRNPFGQTYWNGRGSDNSDYKRFLPDIWMAQDFYWGLNFSDPMHFQYVSGY